MIAMSAGLRVALRGALADRTVRRPAGPAADSLAAGHTHAVDFVFQFGSRADSNRTASRPARATINGGRLGDCPGYVCGGSGAYRIRWTKARCDVRADRLCRASFVNAAPDRESEQAHH